MLNQNISEWIVGMPISSQLKHWRKVKGMTQNDLANKIGVHQSAIGRVENDLYLPSLSFLIKVAKGLGKRVEVKLK